MVHVGFDAGAMIFPSTIEPLVLRAIQAEPLLLGAFGPMDGHAPFGEEHLAAFLAQALLGIDRSVGAIVLPIAIPARCYPIPA